MGGMGCVDRFYPLTLLATTSKLRQTASSNCSKVMLGPERPEHWLTTKILFRMRIPPSSHLCNTGKLGTACCAAAKSDGQPVDWECLRHNGEWALSAPTPADPTRATDIGLFLSQTARAHVVV